MGVDLIVPLILSPLIGSTVRRSLTYDYSWEKTEAAVSSLGVSASHEVPASFCCILFLICNLNSFECSGSNKNKHSVSIRFIEAESFSYSPEAAQVIRRNLFLFFLLLVSSKIEFWFFSLLKWRTTSTYSVVQSCTGTSKEFLVPTRRPITLIPPASSTTRHHQVHFTCWNGRSNWRIHLDRFCFDGFITLSGDRSVWQHGESIKRMYIIYPR